jgi:hypothetical protein
VHVSQLFLCLFYLSFSPIPLILKQAIRFNSKIILQSSYHSFLFFNFSFDFALKVEKSFLKRLINSSIFIWYSLMDRSFINQAIENIRSHIHLDLEYKNITPLDLRNISQEIKQIKVGINLKGNSFGAQGISHLVRVFQYIVELDLQGNALNEASASQLSLKIEEKIARFKN